MKEGLQRLHRTGGHLDDAILWGGGIVRTVLRYLDGHGTEKAHFAPAAASTLSREMGATS